jgi:selenide,water dikinase
MDDAAVVHPPGAASELVLSVDVITPIVDDPVTFGDIAAKNALSDVYAMGAKPELALSFVGMPEQVGLDVLAAVLTGVQRACTEAGCAIVGGHSIRDSEPKVGLTVIGSVAPGQAWTHLGAKPGQLVVLSKALGTGLIAHAVKAEMAIDGALAAATASMLRSNAGACAAGLANAVRTATDVTGFGLLGHLSHILSESAVGARVFTNAVPLLPGALEAAAEGCVPGGTKRNRGYVEGWLVGKEHVAPERLTALVDAQTSGGLLLVVDASRADALLAALGAPASVVAEITDQSGKIELA